MPAVIRRLRFHDGSIRLGPECRAWGDPYTRSLSFEVRRVNVAVIGGLTMPRLTALEYRWIEDALIAEGLRAAMERCKPGRQPYLVPMAMPKLSKRNRPARSEGPIPKENAMSHGKHGPSIKHTEGPDGEHAQDAVLATTEAGLQMMKDGKLHVEPVTEYHGTFKGREGVFKTFHAAAK